MIAVGVFGLGSRNCVRIMCGVVFFCFIVSAATRNALGLVDDDDDAGIDSGCDRSSCRFGGVLHSACLQFLPIMSLQPNFG